MFQPRWILYPSQPSFQWLPVVILKICGCTLAPYPLEWGNTKEKHPRKLACAKRLGAKRKHIFQPQCFRSYVRFSGVYLIFQGFLAQKTALLSLSFFVQSHLASQQWPLQRTMPCSVWSDTTLVFQKSG